MADRPPYKNLEPGDIPFDEYDRVELKYDGWFTELHIEGHQWKLYSRTDRLIEEGELESEYPYTVLYGEYIFGTEWAKDHPELYSKIVVYGGRVAKGMDCSDLPQDEVRELILVVVDELNECEDAICGGLMLVGSYQIEEAPALWAHEVLERKFEGLVFKKSNGVWSDGFARMKAEVTMDYVCIGFLESDSDTYAGNGVASVIGGLYVDGDLIKKCKVSGLTDELRREFYANPNKYVGRVFEAKGKKVSKKGALRHPDFIRWRDDKSPVECAWNS